MKERSKKLEEIPVAQPLTPPLTQLVPGDNNNGAIAAEASAHLSGQPPVVIVDSGQGGGDVSAPTYNISNVGGRTNVSVEVDAITNDREMYTLAPA